MKVVTDPWLTDILQRDVYRLVVDVATLGKNGNDILCLNDLVESKADRPIFAYTKVATAALPAVKFVEQLGFNLIDTNIVFDKPISSSSTLRGHCQVRLAVPADEAQTVEVARQNFIYSRFHLDNAIPLEVANTIKAEWVRNYFLGQRGQQMVVAAVDGRIVGFLQLLYSNDDALIIDLIAVDKEHHRKAIASDMIAFAEANCGGFKQIRVGTQIANIPSIQLYEKIGFRMAGADYVFHYHG